MRYVTSHYQQLQGLRLVALGIMMLLLLLSLGLKSPWDKGLFALLLGLLGLSWRKIGVYYERRFGILHPARSPVRGLNLRFTAVLLLVLLAVFVLHLRIILPEWILGLTFAGLWAVEERRWYYLVFGAVFVLVGLLYRAPHPRLWTAELWLMPVGLIFGGILDHLYLVRSMPGAPSNGNA